MISDARSLRPGERLRLNGHVMVVEGVNVSRGWVDLHYESMPLCQSSPCIWWVEKYGQRIEESSE